MTDPERITTLTAIVGELLDLLSEHYEPVESLQGTNEHGHRVRAIKDQLTELTRSSDYP